MSVRQIHVANIDVSAYNDQDNRFPRTRSTIEQTAIPEKAIIPESSHICLLVSFLCKIIMSEG